ncbi:hypothetical protein EJ04DRAFT_304375 [Polyplosphaeria fusca]|uniref:C2H2-type domain-containing protein n=1 Tax=Polyplosphaeria fusca TaxID=682080 RepID=A0A9P4V1X5_9PLEO|nr:hypothetical protein EJ04DRAFT_304375 [Polyplosphaeria fusca]
MFSFNPDASGLFRNEIMQRSQPAINESSRSSAHSKFADAVRQAMSGQHLSMNRMSSLKPPEEKDIGVFNQNFTPDTSILTSSTSAETHYPATRPIVSTKSNVPAASCSSGLDHPTLYHSEENLRDPQSLIPDIPRIHAALSRPNAKRSRDERDWQPRQRRKLHEFRKDERNRLLACPFAKMDPLRHAKCFDYIFEEISRLKQHLLRVHQLPIHCVRCSATFQTEEDRDTHLREATGCTAKPGRFADGITPQQKQQLAKRVSSKKTREENWYLIYGLLFPKRPKPHNPYVDKVECSGQLSGLREAFLQKAPATVTEFADAELPAELRCFQAQIEQFAQLAFERVFDSVYDHWTNEASLQSSLSPMSTTDSGYASGLLREGRSSPPPSPALLGISKWPVSEAIQSCIRTDLSADSDQGILAEPTMKEGGSLEAYWAMHTGSNSFDPLFPNFGVWDEDGMEVTRSHALDV